MSMSKEHLEYKKENKKVLITVIDVLILIVITASLLSIVYSLFAKDLFATNITSSPDWKSNETFKTNSIYFYEKGNVKIKINIDKECQTETMSELLSLLNNSNENFIKDCSNIEISKNPVAEKIGVNDKNVFDYEAAAVEKTIYFEDKFFCSDTFYHEMSHVYDVNNGDLSQNNEFGNLYNNNFDNIEIETTAVCDTPREGFAVASAYFWDQPELLEELSPEIYNFFQSIYNTK